MITRVKMGLIVLLFTLALALLFSNYATPDYGIIYQLKRFQENQFLRLKSSQQQKADYMNTLLEDRLSELKYLVENRKIEYILSSSSRYFTTAGRLADLIKEGNLLEKAPAIYTQFINHQKVLESLVALCQKNDNTECKYIQDDVNYLKVYLNTLPSK